MGLRVIGGELRGRRLRSVRGYRTRPTADRIREALFDILSKRVVGAIVLDLFAGTGALGIEAMSRGAESALFIDSDTRATRIIEQNITVCSLERRARCIRWDIVRNLKCLRPYAHTFDLVLMDPPYDSNMIRPSVANLYRSGCLKSNAWIVIEHGGWEAVLEESVPFSLFDQRRYGKTLVSFLTNVILEEPLVGEC